VSLEYTFTEIVTLRNKRLCCPFIFAIPEHVTVERVKFHEVYVKTVKLLFILKP
jgi:hypothetical protein